MNWHTAIAVNDACHRYIPFVWLLLWWLAERRGNKWRKLWSEDRTKYYEQLEAKNFKISELNKQVEHLKAYGRPYKSGPVLLDGNGGNVDFTIGDHGTTTRSFKVVMNDFVGIMPNGTPVFRNKDGKYHPHEHRYKDQVTPPDRDVDKAVKPQWCKVCDTACGPTQRFCHRCGRQLFHVPARNFAAMTSDDVREICPVCPGVHRMHVTRFERFRTSNQSAQLTYACSCSGCRGVIERTVQYNV